MRGLLLTLVCLLTVAGARAASDPCAHVAALARRDDLSSDLSRHLKTYREQLACSSTSTVSDTQSIVEIILARVPALEVIKRIRTYDWHLVDDGAGEASAAVQQLKDFLETTLFVSEPAPEPVEPDDPAPPSVEPESEPATTSRALITRPSRYLSSATCGFQTATSGEHSVTSNCSQTQTVTLTGNMTVEGQSTSELVTIERGSSGRHFTVGNGHTLVLRALRLLNGAVSTSISGCSHPAYAICSGGIIYASNGGHVDMWNVTLQGGRAYYGGPVFAYNSASVYVNASTLHGNSAYSGGGPYLYYRSTATISHSTLHGNSAADGGCVSLSGSSTATISHSTVHGNSAQFRGGGLFLLSTSTATILHSTLHGNFASRDGGGVSLSSSTATISHSTLHDNSAPYGGGLFLSDSSTATLNNTSVFNNTAATNGNQWRLTDSTSRIHLNLCAPGTYYDPAQPDVDGDYIYGDYLCPQKCAIGTYVSGLKSRLIRLDGSSPCHACPPGTFCNTTGMSQPQLCPPGSYNDISRVTACSGKCAPGYYCPAGSRNGTVRTCPTGRYRSDVGAADANACDACGLGYRCEKGLYVVPCEAGRYSDHAHAITCKICPQGYFSESNASSCTECTDGTYQDKSDSPFCLPCVPGRFRRNATTCDACPPGKYTAEPAQTTCIDCAAGQYTFMNGSTTCVRVPPGAAANGQQCTAGAYCAGGAAPPTPCAPGSYAENDDATQCLPCIPGMYASEFGSTHCENCPAGYAAGASNASECIMCAEKSYAPAGSSACSECPARSTSDTAAHNITDCFCQQGYWRPLASDELCVECPKTAFCPDKCWEPQARPGYWSVPWRNQQDEEPRLACLSTRACKGPTESNTNTTAGCASSYRGPLCGACKPGFYRATGSYDCVQCNENKSLSGLFIFFLFVVVIAVIAVVTKLTLDDGGQAAPVDVVMAKITMNHFIIASAAATFPLRWPAFLRTFMSIMSVLSASAMGDSAFSVDCITHDRPVQVWGLITVVMPPVFVAAAYLVFYHKRRSGAPHFAVTTLVILILGHPTICKGAFSLVSCRTIAGRPFLEADFAVSCWSGEYIGWAVGLAMPSLILYGLGIPAYYFWRMRRLHDQNTLAEHRDVYGFLFSGYDDDRWWYELWNTIRKAVFTGLTILLVPLGPAMQAWGALLLLIGFIVMFLRSNPYKQPWLNALERDALSVDALTLFMGLALFLNNTNSNSDARSPILAQLISISIVCLNVWFVVRVVRCLRAHSSYALSCKRKARVVGHEVGHRVSNMRKRVSIVLGRRSGDEGVQQSTMNPVCAVDDVEMSKLST